MLYKLLQSTCSTDVAKITKQILLALEYLHSMRITHRNLSLGNIQLDAKVTKQPLMNGTGSTDHYLMNSLLAFNL